MPDFSESMEFKIFPNTGEINPAFESWGKKADDLSTRVGQAMIRGMSAAAGAGTMTQPRSTDPMAALTTIPEQERLLKQAMEQAGPLLRRNNSWLASQEEKARLAARREMMGSLGRAAMGEAVGSIGGLGGVGAMVAGGVTPGAAVTAAVEIIKKPFDALAATVRNSERELAAMNSNIGPAAVGFEQAANRVRWIPLIGDQLATFYEAQRHTAEQFRSYLALAAPGADYRLRFAQQTAEATMGRGELRRLEAGGGVEAAAQATNVSGLIQEELRARNEERRPWYRRGILGMQPFGDVETKRRSKEASALSEQLDRVAQLAKEGKGVDPATEADIRRQLEASGIRLGKPQPPALPAQITGIEDYLTDLYTRFASLPDKQDQTDAIRENTEALNRVADAIEDNGKDHAEEGVDRAMAGDDEIAQLQRDNPWWR